tara:strand:+ start:632 stop:1003 length:372 start_codon:yes stop_codon:yes gene_type:complete
MATPLNTFKSTLLTIQGKDVFTGDSDVVYQTPNGITAIVLMAQVANVDSAGTGTFNVTLKQALNLQQPGIHLIKNYRVAPRDAVSLITGKLIVEQNGVIRCSTDAAGAGKLQLTLSYLESLNG